MQGIAVEISGPSKGCLDLYPAQQDLRIERLDHAGVDGLCSDLLVTVSTEFRAVGLGITPSDLSLGRTGVAAQT